MIDPKSRHAGAGKAPLVDWLGLVAVPPTEANETTVVLGVVSPVVTGGTTELLW